MVSVNTACHSGTQKVSMESPPSVFCGLLPSRGRFLLSSFRYKTRWESQRGSCLPVSKLETNHQREKKKHSKPKTGRNSSSQSKVDWNCICPLWDVPLSTSFYKLCVCVFWDHSKLSTRLVTQYRQAEALFSFSVCRHDWACVTLTLSTGFQSE